MKTAYIDITPQAGWINDFAKGNASSLQSKANTYHAGLFNPFRPNYLGQMASAFRENPSTMSAGELPVNATIGSNNMVYSILRDGIIMEFNAAVTFPSVPANYTAPSGCATDGYKDIWKHAEPTTGTEAVFFTYQTASTAYVGYARVGAIATRSNTYYALTTLSVPHVGCVSVKNLSYVTDGRYLRSYNPNDGSWSQVDCGAGITLQSVADYGNYVGAIGGNGTSSWLFLWDGTSLNLNYKYDVRDTNATALVNEGGTLRVFTYGKNGTTKIKTFSGSGFDEEADFEVPTSLCSSPAHNMVDVWMNQIVWKASQTVSGVTTDGYIWTYGSPRKNEIETGAHRVGIMTTNNTTMAETKGYVKNLYENNLYVGIKQASSYYIYNVKADESYGSTTSSNLKSALYPLPKNSTIEKIQYWFSSYTVPGTASNGSSLTCKIYKDYETTAILNESIPTRADLTSSSQITYFPITQSVPQVDSFYLNTDFTNCVIRRIRVTYTYEENDL